MSGRFAGRALLFAVAILTAATARAGPDLRVVGCDAIEREVHRLVAVELARAPPGGIVIRCGGERVALEVGVAKRTIDLARVPTAARARLLAIALAELAAMGGEQASVARSAVHDAPPREERDRMMFQRVLASGVMGSVLLGTAFADGGGRSEWVVPATEVGHAHPAPRPRDEPKRPAIDRSADLAAADAQLRDVTDSQLRLMKRLIDHTAPRDPDRADLLFRLGELHAEQQRLYRLRARSLDEKVFQARQRGDEEEAGHLVLRQSDLERREERSRLEAARAWIEITDHPELHAAYARTDEVLFRLAHLLAEARHEEAARGYLKRLIKDHPTSRFIPDAWLAFGEHYFEARDLPSALRAYEQVLKLPRSSVSAYARYKTGWCLINLGEHAKALAAFVEVIEEARHEEGGAGAGRLALQREARRDAVRAWAQVGGPAGAWTLFQRIGGEQAPAMLEQLGEIFNSQGKFREAIAVYHQLMALTPGSPRLCAWQIEVVKNTLSATGSKGDPVTVEELARLAAVYDQAARSALLKPDVLRACRDATAGTLRELAMVWHREAQTTGVRATYLQSRELYRAWRDRFPADPAGYTTTFYLGELLAKLATFPGEQGRSCEAADLYGEVVRRDPSPRAKHLRDAAFGAVIAWRSCLDLDDALQASGPEVASSGTLAPQPIPERWQKMIDAFASYRAYVSDGRERLRVAYQEGYALYRFNRFDRAVPLFREVARGEDRDLAVVAGNLLFDCLAAQKKASELAAAVDEVCPRLASHAEFGLRCRTIRASLDRRQAEALERDHRHREAAELYLRIATAWPEYPRIDEVLLNAAVDFDRARLVGRAIAAGKELLLRRPASPLAPRALFQVARSYQTIAAYEAAAESYERFATTWPGERDAPAALVTAAFFRRGLGQTQQAIADTERLILGYGARPGAADQAAAAAFGEGEIFEQLGDPERSERHWRTYLRAWDGCGGVDRQIIAHVRLGELLWRASCPVPGLQGACITVAPAARGADARRAARGRGVTTCCDHNVITVHDRHPARSREAMAHFDTALALWRGGAAAGDLGARVKSDAERAARASEMASHAAEARMRQGDAEYEALLRMRVPVGLDFARAPRPSQRRFARWLDDKTRALERTRKVYESVILLGQAHFAIAASARIGQLFADLTAQLGGAPIPAPPPVPRGQDAVAWRQTFRDAYCDGIGDQVAVLEDKAVDAFGRCLGKATELSWYSEWSSLCEAELNLLRPREYPIADEIRAQPGYAAVGLVRD
ncbi:MAG: tetratricopeptide repeat protein [Myxococcales bacterium]|nr:tetratricopeptide repeat protein [Myxococcales bacterium]